MHVQNTNYSSLKLANTVAVASLLHACSFAPANPEPPPPERTAEEALEVCHAEIGRLRDWQACFEAGQKLVASGRQPEAIQPLFYACNGQLYDACIELGLLHLRGEGVPRDTKKAREALGSASNRRPSARALGLLVRMEAPPRNASDRNSREAIAYTACARSTTGWPCHNYGVLLACGYFGDVDLPHALSAFHRGCFLADPRSCDLAGKLQSGTTSLPCSLVGPDPDNPVDLTLNLDPPDPSETWPEGEERFERTPFKVER